VTQPKKNAVAAENLGQGGHRIEREGLHGS
jgi:hypothetical protein